MTQHSPVDKVALVNARAAEITLAGGIDPTAVYDVMAVAYILGSAIGNRASNADTLAEGLELFFAMISTKAELALESRQ